MYISFELCIVSKKVTQRKIYNFMFRILERETAASNLSVMDRWGGDT